MNDPRAVDDALDALIARAASGGDASSGAGRALIHGARGRVEIETESVESIGVRVRRIRVERQAEAAEDEELEAWQREDPTLEDIAERFSARLPGVRGALALVERTEDEGGGGEQVLRTRPGAGDSRYFELVGRLGEVADDHGHGHGYRPDSDTGPGPGPGPDPGSGSGPGSGPAPGHRLRLDLVRHRFLTDGGRVEDPWPVTREQLTELVEALLRR